MNIQGLLKTTLLDYPGLVASTIFLGGCNMRCPFCHNMDIVENVTKPSFSIEDVLSHLKKRKGIIEGVCITGGEPTLHPDLSELIMPIKDMGYKVKLDTNGSNPQMITHLLSRNLIDYIAMDIKSSLSEYPLVSGISDIDTSIITDSINIIMNSGIDYEFRTTLISQYHNFNVIKDIASLLQGAKNYYLQSFKDSDFVPNHNLSAFDKDTLSSYKEFLSSYIDNVQLRGI